MRCLYCGKELALFKRLTGGGEFCSDAHRQKYQEEYNQLALSRLLQASPAGENAGKNVSSKARDARAEMEAGQDRGGPSVHRGTDVATDPETEALHEAPVPYRSNGKGSNGSHRPQEHALEQDPHEEAADLLSEQPREEEAPAGPSGFLPEMFQPHIVEQPIVIRDVEFIWNEKPALPEGETVALEAMPEFAGAVSLETSVAAQDSRANKRAPSVEVRDMSRGVLNVNADFPDMVITGLNAAIRPMEVSPPSSAPPDVAVLWEEPFQEFTGFETELGALARLAFVTLGWDEIARNQGLAGHELHVPAPSAAAQPEIQPQPEIQEPRVEEPPVQETVTPARTLQPEISVEETPLVEDEAPPVVEEAAPAVEEAAPAEPVAVEPLVEIESQPVEEPVPAAVTRPLPMTLHGHMPGRGKPTQVFPSAIARTAAIQIPRSTGLPLRPTMVLGPSLAPSPAPVKAEKPAAAPEPVKQAPAPPAPAKREAPAPPSTRPDIKTLIKPAIAVRTVQPEKKEPEKREGEKAAIKPPTPALPEKPKPELSALRKTEERKPVEPKPEDRKPPEQKPVEQKPVEQKPVEQKPEDRKPEVKEEPIRKPAAAPAAAELKAKREPAPEESSSYQDIDLGLPSLGASGSQPGFWAKLPVFAKASVGAALLVVLAGGYLYSTRHDAADAAPKGPMVVAAGNILSSGGAGWDTDWAPDPPNSKRQRRISLMHASQSLSDYRMELEGQIETKAMGWVFRASNPKNFYVEKIEIVKPGLEPKIQLVRFAVIDGVEQPHQNVPLSIPVRPDTMYKVRFEAIGDRFTTWLLDQKVDEWTDSHIASGGVGLYAEAGESLSLKGGLNVLPLVVKR